METDECQKGTITSRLIRQELIGYIANDHAFSQCGGVDFEVAKIFHDGSRWRAEFEAIVAVI